jgi:ARG and Rhodanese-Phosphatase-superfamily-associated Protein domain
MHTLKEELSSIIVGEPCSFGNLAVFPLFRPKSNLVCLDYLLLEDGIAHGKVRITELRTQASVPELHLDNQEDFPILVLDGEELVGAKQNRVLNLTILAPAKQSIVIPVSCVESGRWKMSSAELRQTDYMMYSHGRAERTAHVTESLRSSGTRTSDQRAVWRGIAAKAARLSAFSPTGAMSAMYERHSSSLESYVRAFDTQEGQCGAVFAISGQIVGLEIFDYPEVLRRFFKKLIRSYALDALDSPAAAIAIGSETVSAFTKKVAGAPCFAEPALGHGKDVRFKGPGISGAGLWALQRYIHICAFLCDGQTSESSSFLTRLSRPRFRRLFSDW